MALESKKLSMDSKWETSRVSATMLKSMVVVTISTMMMTTSSKV